MSYDPTDDAPCARCGQPWNENARLRESETKWADVAVERAVEIDALDTELARLRDDYSRSEAAVRQAEAELTKLREELSNAEFAGKAARISIALEDENTKLREENDKREDLLTRLREELNYVVTKYNESQVELTGLREENLMLREDLAADDRPMLVVQRDTLLAALREARAVLDSVDTSYFSANGYAAWDHASGIIRRAIAKAEESALDGLDDLGSDDPAGSIATIVVPPEENADG